MLLKRENFNLKDHGESNYEKQFSTFLETFQFLQFLRMKVFLLSLQLFEKKELETVTK